MGKGATAVFFQPMKSNAVVMEALRRARLGSAAVRSGPTAFSLWGGGVRLGSAAVRSGPTALSLWGGGVRLGERRGTLGAYGPRCAAGGVCSGPAALSLWGGGGGRLGSAAQAQGLRPFAMRLSPHIPPEKYRPENPQAASRPVFFGRTARLVEKIKNPLTRGRRSVNVCVRRC